MLYILTQDDKIRKILIYKILFCFREFSCNLFKTCYNRIITFLDDFVAGKPVFSSPGASGAAVSANAMRPRAENLQNEMEVFL